MVKAMSRELRSFALLYVVSLIGACIGLRGLFYGMDGYESNSWSFLTIYSITFGIFDFTVFDTNSTIVNVIGILITVGILLVVPIIFINLIIAQMTNSYQTVKENSYREWSFSKAKLVKQYVMRQEKNIFVMLPAPFNIITAICGDFDMRYNGIAVLIIDRLFHYLFTAFFIAYRNITWQSSELLDQIFYTLSFPFVVLWVEVRLLFEKIDFRFSEVESIGNSPRIKAIHPQSSKESSFIWSIYNMENAKNDTALINGETKNCRHYRNISIRRSQFTEYWK
jgi:hypothetical protein